MFKVFISHSNEGGKDKEETLHIAAALRRAGYSVWVDFENVRGGAAWLCEFEAGIQRCDALLLALSASRRESSWVERECRHAFQLKKPMIAALVADVVIPLPLVNIPRCDLRDRQTGRANLLEALAALRDGGAANRFLPAAMSREPVEANFFPYVEQLPGGGIASIAARDLFDWARQVADETAFGGASNPGFHARLNCNGRLVTILSVRAYRRKPSAQIPLDYLASQAPFSRRAERRKLLNRLNRILPREARIEAAKADRRPTFSLRHLSDGQRRADFKKLLMQIADALRA